MEDKKIILMVEDDSFLRNLYRDKLEKEGFGFIEATSGIEGMNKSDMIAEIPVIVLSNLKQKNDIDEARRLNARDYFIKSETNFSEIIERIKELL